MEKATARGSRTQINRPQAGIAFLLPCIALSVTDLGVEHFKSIKELAITPRNCINLFHFVSCLSNTPIWQTYLCLTCKAMPFAPCGQHRLKVLQRPHGSPENSVLI